MFVDHKKIIAIITAGLSLLVLAGFGHTTNLRGDRTQSAPQAYHILHIGSALVGESLILRDNVTLLIADDSIARIEDGYLSAQDLDLADDAEHETGPKHRR